MPHITANLKDEEEIAHARRIALSQGKSLRQWAGEVVHNEIATILETERQKIYPATKRARGKR